MDIYCAISQLKMIGLSPVCFCIFKASNILISHSIQVVNECKIISFHTVSACMSRKE